MGVEPPSSAERTSKGLILVADDDPELLALVTDALVQRGYDVLTALDGKQALDRASAERPDLVLLDMNMPVMDGWAFAKELRERYGRGIPIVVITAAEESQLRAEEIGAEGELGKPFDLEQLYDIVEDTLVRSSA